MSEIQGFGPGQPIRPASPLSRPAPSKPAEQVEESAGFGSDAVQVTGSYDQEAARLHEAPSGAPAARTAPTQPGAEQAVGRPAIEEIDGFIVAGGGAAASGLSRGADAGRATPTGPIAMIDEPVAAEIEFPGLSLNGPSSAGEGLFDLSGRRLA